MRRYQLAQISIATLLLASVPSATPKHKERYIEGSFPLTANQTCKLNVANGKDGVLSCDNISLCPLSQIRAIKTGEAVPHHNYVSIYTKADTYGTFELGKDDGGIVVLLALATNVVVTDYQGRILFPKDKAPTQEQ